MNTTTATSTSSRHTHMLMMLASFKKAGAKGWTSDEALDYALDNFQIPFIDGHWKRVSDLRKAGYIEVVLDKNGNKVRRPSSFNRPSQVYRITEAGKTYLAARMPKRTKKAA